MVRALTKVGILLCGLLLAAPASADVIYFKPGVPIPKRLDVKSSRNPGGWGVPFTHPTSGKTYVSCKGRILKVVQGVNPTRIRFEPARMKMVAVPWAGTGAPARDEGRTGWTYPGREPKIEWNSKSYEIGLSDLRRIDHEFESVQDLRFAFSNRDRLLSPSGKVRIGEEPFRSCFLAAGGVPVSGDTRRSVDLKRAFDKVNADPGLQEGWLVNWLRRGPLTSRKRVELFSRAFGPGGRPSRPEFSEDPAGFHPVQWETDIRTLVLSMIRAAAQARRYSRPGPGGEKPLNPNGPFGLGLIKPGEIPGDQSVGEPKFSSTCINAIMALCDQVTLDDRYENARDMGFRARDAVLGVLEAAALGRQDPAARRAARGRPQVTSLLRVDPSDMALVALKVIVKSKSWKIPRFDTLEGRALFDPSEADPSSTPWEDLPEDERPERALPGRRLIQALLALARDPNDYRELRARDHLRSRIPTRFLRGVPGYGSTTYLKAQLVPAMENLMAGRGRRVFLRHVSDVLVNTVAQVEMQADEHSTSVREFAMLVIGRSGFGDPMLMRDVVDRLFSIALMPGEDAGPGAPLTLRGLIRKDAVISLSHLASLGERGRLNMERRGGDREDGEFSVIPDEVAAYQTTTEYIRERTLALLKRRHDRVASLSEERFIERLHGLASSQAGNRGSAPTIGMRPLARHTVAFDAFVRDEVSKLERDGR